MRWLCLLSLAIAVSMGAASLNQLERIIEDLTSKDSQIDFSQMGARTRGDCRIAALEKFCPPLIIADLRRNQRISISAIPPAEHGLCLQIVWSLYVNRWATESSLFLPPVHQIIIGASALNEPAKLVLLLTLIEKHQNEIRSLEFGIMDPRQQVQLSVGADANVIPLAAIPEESVDWFSQKLLEAIRGTSKTTIVRFRANYSILRTIFNRPRMLNEFWSIIHSWQELRELGLWSLAGNSWFNLVIGDGSQWRSHQLKWFALQWNGIIQDTRASWLAGVLHDQWRSTLHTLALLGPDAAAVSQSLTSRLDSFSQLRQLNIIDFEGRMMNLDVHMLRTLLQMPSIERAIVPAFAVHEVNVDALRNTIEEWKSAQNNQPELWFPCIGHNRMLTALWRIGWPRIGCYQSGTRVSTIIGVVTDPSRLNEVGFYLRNDNAAMSGSFSYPLNLLFDKPLFIAKSANFLRQFGNMRILDNADISVSSLAILSEAIERKFLPQLESIKLITARGAHQMTMRVELFVPLLCNPYLKRAVLTINDGILLPFQLLALMQEILYRSTTCALEELFIELNGVDFPHPQARVTFTRLIEDTLLNTRLRNSVISIDNSLTLKFKAAAI